jgi:hypothetical protein
MSFRRNRIYFGEHTIDYPNRRLALVRSLLIALPTRATMGLSDEIGEPGDQFGQGKAVTMADDQEDEASRLLKKILSPAEAQSLVPPPPDHAPASGPGESTPVTGSLAKPPSQATPARQGLARYFAGGSPADAKAPDRSSDPLYIKVSSKGQVGYLPKANLPRAMQIDRNLKVLGED